MNGLGLQVACMTRVLASGPGCPPWMAGVQGFDAPTRILSGGSGVIGPPRGHRQAKSRQPAPKRSTTLTEE